ncbi:MAG TPA: hypothetical protein VLH39_05425 [Magnetospirillaceae bacterium]|nr:hypothetical protein [Magnetospirillaceae bacterium]
MNLRRVVKIPGGKLLKLSAEVEGMVLKTVSIQGDFFAHPEEGFDRAEAALIGIPVSGFRTALAGALGREGVELFGLAASDIADVFEEMLHDIPPA